MKFHIWRRGIWKMVTVKRFCLILPVIMLSIMTGCSTKKEISTDIPETASVTQNSVEQAGITEGETISSGDQYYRYQISYSEQTQEKYGQILTTLLGSESAWQQASEKVSTVDGSDAARWSATVDGIQHEWYLDQSGFTYSNDRSKDSVDELEAEKIAQQFLTETGLDAVLDTTITGNLGNRTETILVYRLTVDGLPMMGGVSLSFTDQEDEIPLTGAYLRITVGTEGICGIQLYPLPEIEATLETYEASENFLPIEEAETQAEAYVQASAEKFSYTEEILSAEGWLIYMPTKLGTKVLLIPAYEIEVMGQKNETERVHLIIMDAQNGYVYYHTWNNTEQEAVEWTGEK
jgi:hypothetical protein